MTGEGIVLGRGGKDEESRLLSEVLTGIEDMMWLNLCHSILKCYDILLYFLNYLRQFKEFSNFLDLKIKACIDVVIYNFQNTFSLTECIP